MNILLVYATNSGGTLDAATIVKDTLSLSHTVLFGEALDAKPDMLTVADLVIFASPSWDYEGKEGQPHEHFMPLLQACAGKTFPGKSFAILGLGDSSYTHFCGAADYFEEFVKTVQGKLLVPSLRIDGYYQKPDNADVVKKWADQLGAAISPPTSA